MLQRVWEPFRIKDLELRNRIVRSPHSTGFAGHPLSHPDRDLLINDALIEYHAQRARGGVALSVLEAAGVHPSCAIGPDYSTDAIIPGLRKLTAAVNREGMRVFQQLFHVGPHAPTPDGTPSWAASPIAGLAGRARGITTGEIADVVANFAAWSRRAREGGVDGVEIHAAHGYLLGSFLSAGTNERTDEYGGSFENRLRFVREVIAAIRAEVGGDYIVGIRMSTEDGVRNGLESDEAARVGRALTEGGELDYVSMSCGNTGLQSAKVFAPAIYPRGYEVPFSRKVTQAVDVPTILAGRFLSLEDAEQALERGDGDLISMVRALIADPELVETTRRGGRARPCIGCSQACVGGIFGPSNRLECTVNVAAGHELHLSDGSIVRADAPRRVLIAGGGPAGLEAARVAALAGHAVTLYERRTALGGQLRLAGRNPKRAETASIIGWWESELERLGVDVHLGATVDRALIDGAAPDTIIIATGSAPRRDGLQSMQPGLEIEGFSADRVLTSWDVLEGAEVGARAVVYDDLGHYEAIDVAEHLLERGVSVDYVTRFATVGQQLEGYPSSWGAIGQPHLEYFLGHDGFTLHPRSLVVGIAEDAVTVASQDVLARTRQVAADTVVMVSGNLVQRPALGELSTDVRIAGDASYGPLLLRAAVLAGNAAARALTSADRLLVAS